MLFNVYLKTCRKEYDFTQEQLVQELYNFHDIFSGVDARTLSRWETAQTIPSIERLKFILKYFHSFSGKVLACFDETDKEKIEDTICTIAIKNTFKKSKEHVLNFPSNMFRVEDTNVKLIRDCVDIDKVLKMPFFTIENLTSNVHELSIDILKSWALHPSNLFIYCEYGGQFGGFIFTLRLKPEIFKQAINFEIKLKDITVEDLADLNEAGCNYPISYFALNEKIAQLLSLRYYAHLIAHQDVITHVGAVTYLKGAKNIVKNMNIKYYKTHKNSLGEFESYSSTLCDVLVNDTVIKMIFQK